jgi:DNA replication initiation complex subunit (GINS family)
MLSHIDLSTYYQMIFALAQHHKYSITEIEDLIPYERDIYFSMLVNFIEEQKERAKNKNGR